ncbi:MAG: hypothetical protein ACI4EI_04150 [Muricoprocola sp.]
MKLRINFFVTILFLCILSSIPAYAAMEEEQPCFPVYGAQIDRALSYLEQVSSQKGTEQQTATPIEPVTVDLEDGEYSIEVSMTGGSGKASVVSPALMIVEDGKAYVELVWSSSNYDYMIVGTEKYLNENEEGGYSTFHIPIGMLDKEITLIADTTAMGTPHEVSYLFTFYSESIDTKDALPQEAAKKVIAIAIFIIVGGGILNHYVNKKRRV